MTPLTLVYRPIKVELVCYDPDDFLADPVTIRTRWLIEVVGTRRVARHWFESEKEAWDAHAGLLFNEHTKGLYSKWMTAKVARELTRQLKAKLGL